MNICFYTSDYGYGHAARDIAIIRRIAEGYKANFFVKTDGPFDFIKHSLPFAKVIRNKNDIGVVFKPNSVIVDRSETEKNLNVWTDSWDKYILNEKRFCETNKIDLIISDIVPQAFLVSEDLSIPGIGISNFTWHYIFNDLFGNTSLTKMLEEAYKAAKIILVLPFNEEMNGLKKREISLISRKVLIYKEQMRKLCGIHHDEKLIYIGVGKSFNSSILDQMALTKQRGIRILVSSHIRISLPNMIRIPEDETEAQNYISMCDMIVSKPGYSTVSEAVRSRIPIFLLERCGFKEDELMKNMIKKLNIGEVISKNSFLSGDWIKYLDELDNYRIHFEDLPDRFTRDGTEDVPKFMSESGYISER